MNEEVKETTREGSQMQNEAESSRGGSMNELIEKKNRELAEKDIKLKELRQRLDEKEAENDKLKADIRDKYQSYIDNYESIGSLVYDAKVRSDRMISDAQTKKAQIISEAEHEAQKKIDAVQSEIDKRLDDGEQRYRSVEEELQNLVNLVNQVQRKFMESYKSIHQIVREVPGMNGSDSEED